MARNADVTMGPGTTARAAAREVGRALRSSGGVAYRLPGSIVAPRHLPSKRRRARIRLVLDVVFLILGALGSVAGANIGSAAGAPAEWIVLHVGLVVAVLVARQSYKPRLETTALDHVGQALAATSIATMIVIAGRVAVAPTPDIAGQSVRFWGFAFAYLVAGRLAVAVATRRRDREGIRTLIVGAGTIGQLVARRLIDRPEWGLKPVGFLDKEPQVKDLDAWPDLDILGSSWHLEEVIRRERVEHVVITFSRAPHDVLLDIVRRSRSLGVDVSLVPRLFEEISNRVSVEHLGGIALLRVDQADPRGWQFDLKYAIDRVVGVLAVLLASPLLLSIALAVRLTSPGPVLFRQDRIGLDGHEFQMLKFRTMRSDPVQAGENDAAWAQRALGGEGEAPSPVPTEDRRTPIGRFLRRWSLDELPQLLNVARGDMSLVGPRPERTSYVRAFERHVYRYGDRHRVKSGLTGWAQVHGLRGDTSLPDRIEWDNYYVENWTPWLDLKILLLTPPAVLSGRGAA